MNNVVSKKHALFCFWLITAVYLFITWYTFKGFNGSDDLHYAMLASNMLNGNYSPFAVNDIFSGRILLIAWQACIYFVGGINIFTTQAGTLFTAILCCYLTIFKLGKLQNWKPVLAASALFYFNPVLKEATTGILPDVYVMLAGILILILWKQITEQQKLRWLKPALCGVIAFAAMFFKENALIFIPFLLIIALTGDVKKQLPAAAIAIAVFLAAVLLSGLMYYYFTGDFFFRVAQIKSADYVNPCSFNLFPLNEKIIRLTYGPWQQFIIESFYPVIVAALLLLFRLVFDRQFKLKNKPVEKFFLVFLVLGLYFPFSLKGYQPLCVMSRHFLFMLPAAVILCVSYLEEAATEKKVRLFFIVASAFILLVCMRSTNLKWYWMIYGLMVCYFIITHLIHAGWGKYVVFAAILFLHTLYRIYFAAPNWFQDMNTLAKQTTGTVFYFPEHDNMMHFKLLNSFESKKHYYSLEKQPFKIFAPYYEKPDSSNFKSGWLIVNKAYTVLPISFFKITDSLKEKKYFSKHLSAGRIDAFYIDGAEKLEYVKTVVAANETISK